jgi:hypothetical protein
MQEGFQQFGYVGEKIPIQVENCENYAPYGGTWYRQESIYIHVHIGIGGLTPNTNVVIATIPIGVSPENTVTCHGVGSGLLDISAVHIGVGGKINIVSETNHAMIDIYYLKR